MAVKINFNEAAAKTHTALIQNERAMNKSLLRLSTGMRILSAADDSAGLFIADMLGTVAAALDQGNANIQTGISALQIAETSAGQIYTKLQEIYVRAQRAANDINDPNARTALQNEINNFIDAIQKIATDTEYNGIKLLDGTFSGKYIHYGPRMNQVVTVSITDVRAQNLGAYMVAGSNDASKRRTYDAAQAYANLVTGNWAYNAGDKIEVAGQNLASEFSEGNAIDAKTIADAINNNATLQSLGITATASNSVTATSVFGSYTASGASTTIKFYVGKDASTPVVTITINAGETITLDQLVSEINTQSSVNGSSLRASAVEGKLVLTTNGETIGVEVTVGANGTPFDLSKIFATSAPATVAADSTGSGIQVGKLVIGGTDSFNYDFTGVTESDKGLGISPASGIATMYNLYSIDVSTNANAEQALMIVTKALQKVDSIRGQIGATMNNLQAIYDSQKSAYDNTKEAESVIRNTDYAKEMAEFTSYQIRMQATIAMLAQANTLPQLVLQLLR